VDSVAFTLAKRIRRMRERQGMNQTELATKVLCSKSHVSDIELGHVLPTSDELQRMEEALDADGVLFELYGLVNIGIQESATVADAERDALAMTMWEMRTVPGLLETPEYMRAALSTGVPAARLDREVSIRRGRQRVLGGLKSAWFVLGEPVLRWDFGGPEVMRGQLLRLEEAAMLPNIGIQIMPYTHTRHPGCNGPLIVIEYRDKPGIWFTEGPRSGRMSGDRGEVLEAMHDLSIIKAAALPVHESIDFIRNIRESTYE
jgi:transcriptional regulator with XRE-family HTH domain